MATQTGSIDFTQTGGIKLYAAGTYSTKNEAYQSAQPNLSPFFDIAPNDTDYWFATSNLSAYTTPLGDGWSHIETSSLNLNVSPRVGCLALKESTDYTIMLEVRNVTTLTSCKLYAYTADNSVWDATHNLSVSGEGTYYLKATTKSDLSGSTITHVRIFVGNSSGSPVVNADMRLSIYEGDYNGPYKPYAGPQLYATQAELDVQADKIALVVDGTSTSSSLVLTDKAINAVTDNLTIKGSDGTTTVISGGEVQANSIKAGDLNVTNINASNSLTIGALSTATQADVLNSNVQVGGRNLLRKTSSFSNTEWKRQRTTVVDGRTIKLTPTTGSAYAKYKVNYLDYSEHSSGNYTLSFEYRVADDATSYTSTQLAAYVGFNVSGRDDEIFNTSYDNYLNTAVSTDITSTWTKCVVTVSIPLGLTSGTTAALVTGSNLTVQFGSLKQNKPTLIRNIKLEKGTIATDWTAAPEDMAVGGRNLLQDSKFTTAFNAGWWTLDGLSATLSDNKLVIDGSVAATGNKRVYQSTVRFSHVKDITYTFSCDIVATASCQVSFGRRYGSVNDYGVTFDATTTSQRISGTYTATGIGAFVISEVSNSATVTISNLKLETGNIATDWTPAPEDVDAAISDAAKTASNYITTIDATNGIKIADASPSSATTYLQLASTFLDFVRGGSSMLKAWLDGAVAKVRVGSESGFNTLTDDEGIKLRSGTTIISQFATSLIELGKNSRQAVISLLDNNLSISVVDSNPNASGSTPHSYTSTITSGDATIEFAPISSISGDQSYYDVPAKFSMRSMISSDPIVYAHSYARVGHDFVSLTASEEDSDSVPSKSAGFYADVRLGSSVASISGDTLQLGDGGGSSSTGQDYDMPDVINALDKSIPQGTVVSSSPNAVSVATSSNVTLGSITLAAGTWMVVVSATFASNNSGRRVVYFADDSSVSSVSVSQMAALTQAPADGGMTKYSSFAIVSPTASTTYYCRAWQNSGSTLSCQCYLRAVRIA